MSNPPPGPEWRTAPPPGTPPFQGPVPPPLPVAAGRRPRPVDGPGVVAGVLIGLSVVAGILVVAAAWNTAGVVEAYLADRDGVTESDLEAADQLGLAAFVIFLVVQVAAAVAFVFWLWNARVNTEFFQPAFPHRRARGWVIGGWVCPVVNLWFPFQVVGDVWKASNPEQPATPEHAGVPARGAIGGWWALWLLGLTLDRYANGLAGNADTAAELSSSALLTTLATACHAAAAVLVVLVVKEVNGWQARWLRPAPAGWARS